MIGAPPMPPRLPGWILERMLPSQTLQYALGDLAEEYVLRSQAGSPDAAQWYRLQILRSLPAFVIRALRSAGLLRTACVAIVAYVAASASEWLVHDALARTIPALDGTAFYVTSMVVGLTALAAGGYVAARFQPAAASVMAIIVLAVVVGLMLSAGTPVPFWYEIGFLIVGPIAPLAGGVLASRRTRQLTR